MSSLDDVSGFWNVRNQSQNENIIIFSRETLHKATNGFRTWMGGDRSSYKGTLENGTVVFVKEIRGSSYENFLSLVMTISTIRHPNVVKFLGYCDDGYDWFIVYEFGGVHDLDVLLFTSHSKSVDLTWPTRASICLGIARGLEYLHQLERYHGPVGHGNIKPFNILLDEEYNPKIVGFKINIVDDADAPPHRRIVYGTIGGYGGGDSKAFGILLLEVITGRVLHDWRDDEMHSDLLPHWISDLEGCDDVLSIVDPRLTEVPPEVEVIRFIDVALQCLRRRANMSEVVRMLSGKLDSGPTAQRESQLGIHVHKSGKVVVESTPSDPVIETRGENVHDIEIQTEIEASISDSEPSLEASANPTMTMAPHASSDTFVHNEDIDGLSFEIEARPLKKILSQSAVNLDKPIHKTVAKILKALRDAQHRRICLRGSGGSGKTTVLRTLSHHPAVRNFFDQIIFVSVPRLDYRRKIQSQIMQQLSLNESDYKSEDEAAAQICNALTGTSRKVLLLLDDVREIMNLHEVGIPNLDPTKGCWLLLATRSLDVCQEMADKEIEMEVLSAAEGWELFRCQVGDIVDDPGIEPYARTIAKECHGLPLIISAVASPLKVESDVARWRLALRSILYSEAPLTKSLHFENPSPHIKYCYKMLEYDARPCFLYSASFSSEKEIDISKLVDCFILDGLIEGRTSDSYRKGYEVVRDLVNASLLEATTNGCKVKMHNIMKDSALAILLMKGCQELRGSYLWAIPRSNTSSPTIDKCLARAGAEFKEPPALEEWKRSAMIFLMDNKLSSLPSKPNCGTLEALFLQRNLCIRAIPATFFNNMYNLGILNLSKTRIKILPESFSKLASLQVFIMRDCERLSILPPSIGYLRSLKVLDLLGTELIHLPESVSKLAKLKQLQVSFYGSISHSECNKLPAKLIPDGVISRLDLEELGIFVHPGDRSWALSVSNIIKEVSTRKLRALYFHFPDEKHLDQFLGMNESWKDKLTTFNFVVGHDFKHGTSQVSYDAEMRHHGESRRLRFVNGESVPCSVQKVLSQATSLYLDHHLNICNLSDFGIDNIYQLKICILRDCPNVQAIVHNEQCSRSVLPFLRYLSVNYLWNLKRIWVGPVSLESLQMLRHLSLQACPKLTYVLTYAMLDNLSSLEELVIEDCASLLGVTIEQEVAMDDVTSCELEKDPGVSEMSPATREAILPRLKVLKLHHLPKLCGIWKGHRWPPLKYISFYNCPELKNLHLEARDAMNIREIAVDKAWWDLLEWDNPTLSRKFDEHVVQINLD